MECCILAGGGYQDLVQISESCLRNPLFVLDSSYRLIAAGTRYRSRDPIHKELYETGYFPDDVLERFSSNKRLDEYYNRNGITVSEEGRIGRSLSFGQWCRFKDAAPIQIVEVFEDNPPAADSKDLFSYMMHYFDLCFEAEQKKNAAPDSICSRILREMLHGELKENVQQKAAAEKIGISYSGTFQVFAIRFNQIEGIIKGRFLHDLNSVFTGIQSVFDDQTFYCLVHQPPQKIERIGDPFSKNWKRFSAIMMPAAGSALSLILLPVSKQLQNRQNTPFVILQRKTAASVPPSLYIPRCLFFIFWSLRSGRNRTLWPGSFHGQMDRSGEVRPGKSFHTQRDPVPIPVQ